MVVSRHPMKIMMALAAVVLAFAVHPEAEANAERVLGPATALSKIRDRLMGDWPTENDWRELEAEMNSRSCREVSCLQDFFGKKIREYTATPRYVGRMSLKVEELLYLRSSAFPWERSTSVNPQSDSFRYDRFTYETFNAMTALSRKVFAENRPWDHLYTSQMYSVFPSLQGDGVSEELWFFRKDDSEGGVRRVSDNRTEALPATVAADLTGHPNASGVFSTPRFLTRFWNSSLNQGRKRAAAVFRVMICDSLFPALERRSQALEETRTALGLGRESDKGAHGSLITTVNRHATDPACIRCHERLDPLAWSMRGLEVGLSARAFPGRVRFYDESGKITNFEVDDFRSAIRVMTEQSKYRSCQVEHFVRWIIGRDVRIPEDRMRQLESAFDNMGRKTNDFVEYLMLTPEFLTPPRQQRPSTSGPVSLYEGATRVLMNCVRCHGSSYPFMSLEKWDEGRLRDIAHQLDLIGGGQRRQMPPAGYDRWQPTSNDLDAVKKWIEAGAPDAAGTLTFDPSKASAVLENKR